MLKYDFYRGWYLPSNGTIANVVLHDLNLHFQDHKFEMLNIRNGESYNKNASWLLPRLIIRHRMAPLWMLYSVTLTFIFKVKHFLAIAFATNCTCSIPIRFCLDLHDPCLGVALVYNVVQWFQMCESSWDIQSLRHNAHFLFYVIWQSK